MIHTSIPILDQLRIEEALLRADNRNFCIINHPPKDDKAIVLGISGKPELLVHLENVERDDIPLIKRFSGGGTVYTDERVVLVSFIFENSLLPDVKCFPRPIMDWTEEFYSGVIQNKHFALTENDYCVGSRKFGGNAQSITRKRWLHVSRHYTIEWKT